MRHVSAKGIIAGLVVIVVAAVCIRLGFWQLDRLESRRARNAKVAAALAAPPLRLDSASIAAVSADPARYQYRPVRVTGVWDDVGRFLLRGRGRRGAPGVHLVTPLRLEGIEAALLVDRGWLPSPDATTADPRPYRQPGTVTVEGTLQLPPPPTAGGPRPVTVQMDGMEVPTYQRLDPAVLQASYRTPILPFYVARTAPATGQESAPFGADPPRLDQGPHLGYAVQWFGFAAVAVIGFIVAAARLGRRG